MLEVHVQRGDLVDSVHQVSACAVDPTGDVQWASDDWATTGLVYLRSAAKPFQATLAVSSGTVDALGLDDRHLAVACGSHNASPEHLARIDEILAAAGLSHDDLGCGDDGAGSPFRHQCSGNHAMALAVCVHQGWPVATYLDPASPLQVTFGDIVGRVCGVTPQPGPDGCGMTAFAVPLSAAAHAFGRLALGWDGLDGLARCRDAMRRYPDLVRWAGEADTELMRHVPGVVAKFGAEALVAIGGGDGSGAAIRVRDGGIRALPAAALWVTDRRLGTASVAALDPLRRPVLWDNRGQAVGDLSVTSEDDQ